MKLGMKYVDGNGKVWSIDKGDWLPTYAPDLSFKRKLNIRKIIKFTGVSLLISLAGMLLMIFN